MSAPGYPQIPQIAYRNLCNLWISSLPRVDNILGRSVFLPFAFYSLKTEIVNYVDLLPQRKGTRWKTKMVRGGCERSNRRASGL